jgi:hypothetical protein
MQTILIEPKDVAEYNLLTALLEKMKVRMKVLNMSDEEREDFGLLKLMEEVDWNDTVPEEEILSKLRKRKRLVSEV